MPAPRPHPAPAPSARPIALVSVVLALVVLALLPSCAGRSGSADRPSPAAPTSPPPQPLDPVPAAEASDPCIELLQAWLGLATADPFDPRADAERVDRVRRQLPEHLRPRFDRWWTTLDGTIPPAVAGAPEIDEWFAQRCP